MLASDLNNPEFVGAVNPDSALAVTFRWDKRLNEFRSKEEGRPIYDWMDWIHIQVPGNQLTDINRPAESRDKLRFPIQWARYQAAKEGGTVIGVGTPLEQWPLIGREVAESLRYFKFFTVENIAEAADGAIQGIGMAGGMDPLALKEKARAWLKAARTDADATKQAELLEQKEKEIAELRAKQEETNAKIDALMNMLQQQQAQAHDGEEVRRGPGRPRKEAA